MGEVLVTGARGYIGRHVAKYFSSKGHSVTGIGRGSWGAADRKKWGIDEWLDGEITLERLHCLSRVPEVLVHCAGTGVVSYSFDATYKDFIDNVQSVACSLEYVKTRHLRIPVVFLSSAAVYGKNRMESLSENLPAQPISPYGVHKKMAEDLCRSYSEHFGVKCSIVRLFSVYGIGLQKQLLWDACRKIDSGDVRFFGTGDETRDWIHVEDAASLIYLVAQQASSQCPIFNGGSGKGTSVKEILRYLMQGFHNAVSPTYLHSAQPGQPSSYIADMTRSFALGYLPQKSLIREIGNYAKWFVESRSLI